MAPRAASRLEHLGFESVMHYSGGKLDWMASGLPTEGENSSRPRAGTVARKDFAACSPADLVRDVRTRDGTAVVVDSNGVVLGMLREKELGRDGAARVEDVMVCGPSTFRPYVAIKEIADYMTEHELDSTPITTSDGKVVGVLFREDALRAAGQT
jgi:CBS-domain-containing membrane protein